MIDFDLIRKEHSVEQVFFGMLSDAEIVQKAVQEYQAAMLKSEKPHTHRSKLIWKFAKNLMFLF